MLQCALLTRVRGRISHDLVQPLVTDSEKVGCVPKREAGHVHQAVGALPRRLERPALGQRHLGSGLAGGPHDLGRLQRKIAVHVLEGQIVLLEPQRWRRGCAPRPWPAFERRCVPEAPRSARPASCCLPASTRLCKTPACAWSSQPPLPEARCQVPLDRTERPGRKISGVNRNDGLACSTTHDQVRTALPDLGAVLLTKDAANAGRSHHSSLSDRQTPVYGIDG